MTNIALTIGVLGAIIGILGMGIGLIPYFKSKGIDVGATLSKIETALDDAYKILDVTKPLIPKDVATVLEIIEKWSKIAVGNAEQLYHSGDIEKSERAKIAENVVLNILKEMNITIDDNKRALIDANIKNAVNDLGHAKPSDAEKTIKLQEMQSQVVQLTQQNAILKQTIANIQSTARTV